MPRRTATIRLTAADQPATPAGRIQPMGDRPLIYLGPAPATGRAPVVYAHPTLGPGAYWDLEAAPHALVVGSSGAGKTALVRSIGKGALDRGMCLYGGDGKEAGSLSLFKGARNVEGIETRPQAIVAVLEHAFWEMRARYQTLDALRGRAWRTRTRPPAPPDWAEWLVIIDEVNSLLAMLEPGLRRQVVSWLVDLGRRSRESRIHLLLAMQNPRARATDGGLDPELKQQLTLRVALGEIDSTIAGMAFDNYDLAGLSQGEHAPKGRGLLQVGTVWSPFQGAYLPDPCHWETPEADCQRVWRLLPAHDPDWQMFSARHDPATCDTCRRDDLDQPEPTAAAPLQQQPPATPRPATTQPAAAAGGLRSLTGRRPA